MDHQIEETLHAALAGFAAGKYIDLEHAYQTDFTLDKAHAQMFNELKEIFKLDMPFLTKVEALDRYIDDKSQIEPINELLFDLLLINFFTIDALKLEEDYLESKEWEDIEDQTIDRGTEVLNVLLYIKECKEEQIAPDLSDYLKEFLLVEEDEFQDEYHIYEDIIANQNLIDSSMGELAKIADKIAQDSEMKDLFYPIMAFFSDMEMQEETLVSYLKLSQNKPFDGAVLFTILAYQNGISHLPLLY